MKRDIKKFTWRSSGATALACIAGVALSACGTGDASSDTSEALGSAHAGGPGVEYGADAEQFTKALEDAEPINLVMQSASASPETESSQRDIEFAENVEELSGGKITVEIVYGNAVAGVEEVDDALADGRLDLAYMLPIYKPSEYPANSALVDASTFTNASPFVGELVTNAALLDAAWQSPDVLSEFTDRGLTPLLPVNAAGVVAVMCTEPAASLDDLNGKQIRASSPAHATQFEQLGATAVSLPFNETYEGLQRGVIDCSAGSLAPAASGGWLESAPHVMFPSESAALARGPGALLAGSSWSELPLAAQQLIFDQMAGYFEMSRLPDLKSILLASEQAESQGGGFLEFDDDVNDAIATANDTLSNQMSENSQLDGKDFTSKVADANDKWLGIASELGYENNGGFEDFSEWYSEDIDLSEFTTKVYEEIMLPVRPE